MSGNTISVKTLDLNQDFEFIKEQLDEIVENYLIDVGGFSKINLLYCIDN